MKLMKFLKPLLIVFVLANCSYPKPDNKTETVNREFYQLKTYIFETVEQQHITEGYLKHAYLPALKKLNIGPVGIFKNRPVENDSSKRVFVLTPFSSLAKFNQIEKSLNEDINYLAKGSIYLNATYDNPPYARVESMLLRAFEDMPEMQPSALTSPRPDRIYELRSYESATEKIFANKVDMFNAGGEILLFDKLKFNAVFYGEVISGPKMPNLMYMTTHADSASRAINWKNFVDSPEWKEMSSSDKYQNNVSHIDITFLYPTEYSDY